MRGEIARGAAWMVALRLFDRSIGIVSTTLLARLLIPADFGLVAMAMSVIAIVELATSFSFEIALIQKADPQRQHYDTAWTLNVLVALTGAFATAGLAVPTAHFYGDDRLVPVMFAIGAAWLIGGFENIGTVNFRRDMNFAAEFRLASTKRVISFAVTLACALAFRSYWALVAGTVTSRIAGVVLSYAMQPYRPRFSLACARELFSFSGWILANNMVGVALGRAPQFVVGRTYGAETLGAYTLGSEIAMLAQTELVAPINRAMFPGYARLASDPAAFRRVCTDATAAILLVVLPVTFGIAVLADPLVRVLLGEKWHVAVPVIQILSFSGALTALTSNNIAAYLALGRPQLATSFLVCRLLLFGLGLAVFGSTASVVSVAWAEAAASLGSLLISMPVLFSVIRLRAIDYLATLWRPLLAGAAAAALVHVTGPSIADAQSFGGALLRLVSGAVIGGTCYALVLWGAWRLAGRPASVETIVWQRIRAVMPGAKPAA